jgi:predicted nucleic acid-binding protein
VITSVDTNVLLDLLTDNEFSEASGEALASAADAGITIICEVVYAELSVGFSGQEEIDHFLKDCGIAVAHSTPAALFAAGNAWRQYLRSRSGASCSSCGQNLSVTCSGCGAAVNYRQHLISDFIVGAHAVLQADRLLTRDRGYFRRYFPHLQLVEP